MLNKAIAAFENALSFYTAEENPDNWASSQHGLADCYLQREGTERANDLEKAIQGFECALRVYTIEKKPSQWASTQYSLALAYQARIEGVKARNLEKAIFHIENALSVYTLHKQPLDWASCHYSKGLCYMTLTEVSKNGNLEKAVKAFEQSLTVFTAQTNLEKWARSLKPLGWAYYESAINDEIMKKDRLEQAIKSYENALTVYKVDDNPDDWLYLQYALGLAYQQRVKGDKVENIKKATNLLKNALDSGCLSSKPEIWACLNTGLAMTFTEFSQIAEFGDVETAIEALKKALTHFTREKEPYLWATCQNNIGLAYLNSSSGKRSENIDAAIEAFENALLIQTREKHPLEWAGIQMNLSSAHHQRLTDSHWYNKDKSFESINNALEIYTVREHPTLWAKSQICLGLIYLERSEIERPENIRNAIGAFENALSILTPLRFPWDWATVQGNLGIAYMALNITRKLRIDQSIGLWGQVDFAQKALQSFENFSSIFTRERFPNKWAMNQNNIGSLYIECFDGIRLEELTEGIQAFESALSIHTYERYPQDWARIQANLGFAYIADVRECLQLSSKDKGIEAFTNALRVYKSDTYTEQCRSCAIALGNLYSQTAQDVAKRNNAELANQLWLKASEAYLTAIDASELLFQASIIPSNQNEELYKNGDLYRQAAFVMTKLGDLKSAILYLEKGRGKGLSQALEFEQVKLLSLKENICLEKRALYDEYYSASLAVQNSINQTRTQNLIFPMRQDDHARQTARNAHATLKTVINKIRRLPDYRDFFKPVDFNIIEQAVQPECPLVYLFATSENVSTLILTRLDESVEVNLKKTEVYTADSIRNLLVTSNKESTAWFEAYNAWIESLIQEDEQAKAKAYKIWLDVLDKTAQSLWPIMQPLLDFFEPFSAKQVLLIPTGLLSFLPLSIAWTQNGVERIYAMDKMVFLYAPNARVTVAVRERIQNFKQQDSILGLSDPTLIRGRASLPNSELEVDSILSLYPPERQKRVLPENASLASVLDDLKNFSVLHFSCHGKADIFNPLQSGLVMAKGEILTVADLLKKNLSGHTRLAVLSACETGIPGTELPDELTGLPSGFLQAGACGVVSSLWSVSDISTMLVIVRFYQYMHKELEGVPEEFKIPHALNKAQQWVRDTSNLQKREHFKKDLPEFTHQCRLSPTSTRKIRHQLSAPAESKAYAHPFHWAAFVFFGA
jgi:CHAT domain-containing protein